MVVDPDRYDKVLCSSAETLDLKLCFVPHLKPGSSVEHDITHTGPFTRRNPVLRTTNIPTESGDPVGKMATLPVILGSSSTLNVEKEP